MIPQLLYETFRLSLGYVGFILDRSTSYISYNVTQSIFSAFTETVCMPMSKCLKGTSNHKISTKEDIMGLLGAMRVNPQVIYNVEN